MGIAGVAIAAISAVGSVVAAKAAKPKVSKLAAQAQQPLVLPGAQVRGPSALRDAILARRGTRVNQRTGTGGVEAPMGVKSKLGT